eukprot:6705-Pelagomonas_calceolata.AAC.1
MANTDNTPEPLARLTLPLGCCCPSLLLPPYARGGGVPFMAWWRCLSSGWQLVMTHGHKPLRSSNIVGSYNGLGAMGQRTEGSNHVLTCNCGRPHTQGCTAWQQCHASPTTHEPSGSLKHRAKLVLCVLIMQTIVRHAHPHVTAGPYAIL